MSARVIIIAEAGVNHNGDINLAKKLIDIAVESGADYVKFQTYKTEKLVTQLAKKAGYQIQQNTDEDDLQFSMLKKLELTKTAHLELIHHAKDKGIAFLSTAFDEESIDFLDELGIPFFKIPSGEITNLPFLQHVASKGKPIVLSTGMCMLEEVKEAIELLRKNGVKKEDLIVLHCTTDYPTPFIDVNLGAMNLIQLECDVQVGYSDHTLGIEVAIAAVARGAVLIEKHFTLDKSLPGPDHQASLEPNELFKMVQGIRNIESALSGNNKKEPTISELENQKVARKSIHVRTNLSKNHSLVKEDLIMLRPGDGISPMKINQIIGKKLVFDLETGHKLNFNDLCE
jgi:N,N'-diacetyllegionaminate synthase